MIRSLEKKKMRSKRIKLIEKHRLITIIRKKELPIMVNEKKIKKNDTFMEVVKLVYGILRPDELICILP